MSEAFAILSACCVALGSIFLGELKGRISLLQLSRWQLLAAFVMTSIASLVLGGWRTVDAWQLGLLASSGIAGMVVAGTAYVATIHATGPRITALLFSLTSPFTLFLGYLVLGETLNGRQALGVLLVLTGIALAIGIPRRFVAGGRLKPAMPALIPAVMPLAATSAPPKTGKLMPGVLLGILAAFGQAIGTLLARPAMAAGVEPFTAMAIRSGMGALFFTVLMILGIGRQSRQPVDARSWAFLLGAAFVGTTVGMALMMAALQGSDAGVVATLSTITPVVILPMIWLAGREVPSPAGWLGAVVAITGTALISLG